MFPIAPLAAPVLVLDVVDSTNRYLRQTVRPDSVIGTTIVARQQTLGRGRGGHRWVSSAGGLYCSILLECAPAGRFADLSFVAGLAVATTLESFGLIPHLKWPNDCLVARKKIAGILCETFDAFCVVGIGINVRQSDFVGVDCPSFPPTSIFLESGILVETKQVLDRLRRELFDWDKNYRQSGFGAIRRSWEGRCGFLKRPLRISEGVDSFDGVFLGLSESGAMRVRIGEDERVFQTGEVVCFW